MNIWFWDGQEGWDRQKVQLEVTHSDQTTSEELATLPEEERALRIINHKSTWS